MKKNKIVNKIGILVLAVMLSILSSITVLASEPEEAELGPRQDISKNLTTGEITVNEIPANLNKNSSDVMEPFIPEGMKVDPTTREVIGPDNRYRITDTTAYPNSAILTPQKWGVIFNYIFPKTLLIRLAVKAKPEGIEKQKNICYIF